jgi:SAM-dependent methyltransferase
VVSAADGITTRALVDLLLTHGRASDVDAVTDAEPYLIQLAEHFGARDPRSITVAELCDFHADMATEGQAAAFTDPVERKNDRWERAYQLRVDGAVELLQWESPRPVRALGELLDRPDVSPRRVLELGCGDGVNAVFLATRGCAVTAVDLSATAIRMAAQKARRADVTIDLVEGDLFALPPASPPYDLVFDRGTFHHVPVFRVREYVDLVAGQLDVGGHLHLICHHVSTRPTLLYESVSGYVGKLLGFLTGQLVETGVGYSVDEVDEVFAERFTLVSAEVVADDNHRPLSFVSALLRRRR